MCLFLPALLNRVWFVYAVEIYFYITHTFVLKIDIDSFKYLYHIMLYQIYNANVSFRIDKRLNY